MTTSIIIDQDLLAKIERISELESQGIQVGKVDLHGLTRTYTVFVIASALGIKVRRLRSYMKGERCMPADFLWQLATMYPEFDLWGTVKKLTLKRLRKGVSRISETWRENNEDFLEEEL